jgi:NAD+ kinase
MRNKFNVITLYSTKQDRRIISIAKQCHEVLSSKGVKVLLDKNLSKISSSGFRVASEQSILKHSDLMISIGGDGTMLNCSRKYGLKGIPVLGINLGNLGFLNDIPPEELTSSLTKILEGEYSEDNRFFLEASLKGKKTIALNEVVIHSGEIAQLIEYDLFINDSFVYRQKADGLIISSPTGSTAYSLSGGGPIVHPKVKSIMISPMLPLSLSSSSLLVESESKIRVNLVKGSKKAHISFDSQGRFLLEANEEIHLSKSSSCLKLLHPKGQDFFEACRNKLGWSKE